MFDRYDIFGDVRRLLEGLNRERVNEVLSQIGQNWDEDPRAVFMALLSLVRDPSEHSFFKRYFAARLCGLRSEEPLDISSAESEEKSLIDAVVEGSLPYELSPNLILLDGIESLKEGKSDPLKEKLLMAIRYVIAEDIVAKLVGEIDPKASWMEPTSSGTFPAEVMYELSNAKGMSELSKKPALLKALLKFVLDQSLPFDRRLVAARFLVGEVPPFLLFPPDQNDVIKQARPLDRQGADWDTWKTQSALFAGCDRHELIQILDGFLKSPQDVFAQVVLAGVIEMLNLGGWCAIHFGADQEILANPITAIKLGVDRVEKSFDYYALKEARANLAGGDQDEKLGYLEKKDDVCRILCRIIYGNTPDEIWKVMRYLFQEGCWRIFLKMEQAILVGQHMLERMNEDLELGNSEEVWDFVHKYLPKKPGTPETHCGE